MLQESFCGLLWVKSLKPPLILMLAAFSLLSLVFLKARRCLYFLLLPGPASRWSTHNAPAASWSKPQGWGDEKRVWVQWSREFRLGTHMSCSLWWLILRFFRKKQRPHRVLLSGNKTQTLKWQLSSHLVITWRVQNQEKGSISKRWETNERSPTITLAVWREFRAIMQGRGSLEEHDHSLSWGLRAGRVERPRQLEFSGQGTREERGTEREREGERERDRIPLCLQLAYWPVSAHVWN